MNILDRIMAERREAVSEARRRVPLAFLRERAAGRRPPGFRAALRTGPGTRIIAEMKKASPSAGVLRPDYDPVGLGRAYEAAGAAALSVLTEPLHFLGSGEHLQAVRAAVQLPILRKDFVCDAYQIWEAAAWGADAVLLIAAALDPRAMRDLYDEAMAAGIEVLAEAHNEDEVAAVLELPEAAVGVNSRDLKTLKTDLAVARRLAAIIPASRIRIAESGIRTRADILALEAVGYDAFLVGESLLRDADSAAPLRRLMS